MSPHFRLTGDGVEVSLLPHEVRLLSDATAILSGLAAPGTDPGAARLQPPAYLSDPEADAEWRRLAGSELDQARRADRSAVETILEAVAADDPPRSITISIPEAHAMMRVVNDIRLVLGARWGIEESDDFDRLRPEADQVLAFLGWLVNELAGVLGEALDGG